jgi:fructuronate reductase
MARLGFATLSAVPAAVARPAYDAARLGAGIVHLGIGAFHRAHQAIYTDDAIASSRGAWGISGVSLRSPDVRDGLAPQNGLYAAVEKSRGGVRRRIVGSVREVLYLGDERARVDARLAAAETRIISLTVTEKGYCHDPATGALNFQHPDIVRDLANPDAPVSVVGLLTHAFALRRANDAGALTIVCCDNLPHNGKVLHGVVQAFAAARDPALARWIDDHAAFPSTMVDRIVPATTATDIADNDAALGLHDAAPVVFEPYEQWVIENAFATPRPQWEAGGAQFVADVAPFEAMKLRLLNASHSAFAYLGFLAGHEYIYQVAAQPDFVAFMRRFMQDEVTPTLTVPPATDLAAYREALVTRFGNPALPHRTQQIAMDGSQKLPQRLLATTRENLAAGRSVRLATLAVAGWMRYVAGEDEQGRAIAVSDPFAKEFAAMAGAHRGDAAGLARALLGLRPIFGDDLPRDPRFTAAVVGWLAALYADGAARTVARAVSTSG